MGESGTKSERPRRPLTARIKLPLVSGKTSAAALFACLALSAVIIPVAMQSKPWWLEAEVVIAAWWVLWTAALAVLLYRGLRVSDDHQLGAPRSWLAAFKGEPGKTKERKPGSASWGDWAPSGLDLADSEGCLVVLAILIGLVLLFFAAWVVVEIAIPILGFLMYFLLRGMLAYVINDTHHCKGNLFLAVVWGAVWATLFTGPLAAAVWILHVALRSTGA